jgi:hypothetical protein
MAKFTVIPGTPPPDTPKQRVINRLKAIERPPEILECPRCAGREVLELRSGVTHKDGKISGGIKTVVCATCFLKGERVVLA